MQSTDQTCDGCSSDAQDARMACESAARGQQQQYADFMGGPQPSGGELAATGDCPGHAKE